MGEKIKFDWLILAIILFITAVGLLTLFGVDKTLFVLQLRHILIGSLFFIIFSFMPYRIFQKTYLPLFIFIIFFLILPIAFGQITRGSQRWIKLGAFTFQPSEIIKPLAILLFASCQKIFLPFIFLLPIAALIFLQPDLGNTIILVVGWAGTLFHQSKFRKYLFFLLVIALLALPLTWKFIAPFQQQRINSFLNPQADPLGKNYQSQQAVITVGSGQLLGQGLGLGSQSRLAFLPERHNDLLFASFIEAFGFLGGISLLIAYFLLYWHLLSLAKKNQKQFPKAIILGVFTIMTTQTVINIGMNIGLLPITGVNLPLFSYGGSSYLATMISLGLIEAIYRQQPRHFQEWRIR